MPDGRARYQFRVENVGKGTSDAAEVVLSGTNLRQITFQLDGGPRNPLADLDSPGEVRIPIGPLAPGQGRDLRVEGEPARPAEGTRLAGRSTDPKDTNPENNDPSGETLPGAAPDYAVEITAQTVGFELRDGSPQLVLHTSARLTLTLPDGLAPACVRPTVLTTRHAEAWGSLLATPDNLGPCENPDGQTTACTFQRPPSSRPGRPPASSFSRSESSSTR